MYRESSLTKRIKRHVIGRVRTYFAVTSPGFEPLCRDELQALGLPAENVAVIPGGVEFRGRLVDCYQANLHLRTAGRILMRIDRFKATNFRQIENKASQIPWELYLPAASLPRINVRTHHCRLYHSDAIGERFRNCLSTSRPRVTSADHQASCSSQTVYIRGVEDRFSVSIDSSGANLYKRGIKKHAGQAPLRETTAAAALMLAGYRGQKPLIDPMCGTGTFSLEAAMIAQNLPPGGTRQFAFMHWPSFRRKQWEYLKRQTGEDDREPPSPIFASDTDPLVCDRLKNCLAGHRALGVISVSRRDFFDITPDKLTDRIGLIAINPPYGRRLDNRRESEALFTKICSRLKSKYKGWQIILISPSRRMARHVPLNLSSYVISHGGLKPVLMIGTAA